MDVEERVEQDEMKKVLLEYRKKEKSLFQHVQLQGKEHNKIYLLLREVVVG